MDRPGQDRVASLVAEVGVGTYPQTEQGDDVVLEGDTAQRVPDVALSVADEELVAYIERTARS